MKILLSILIAFLLFMPMLPISEAATIKGTIYGISINKAHDVTVDISTIPKQRYISKDGLYEFKIQDSGNYTINANQYDNEVIVARATEYISINGNGSYNLDLILFPIVETQNELLGESIFDLENIVMEDSSIPWWAWSIVFAIVLITGSFAGYLYITHAKKPKEVLVTSTAVVRELDKLTLEKALIKTEPYKSEEQKKEAQKTEEIKPEPLGKDETQSIIDFIQKEGGRTTQKDLRKQFTSSEAKISLMLAELEHKGIIEKIKKGRGNILIFKDKQDKSESKKGVSNIGTSPQESKSTDSEHKE